MTVAAAGVAAAILAGGRGQRMGQGAVAKGLLMIAGERIIDRQLAVLRPLFGDVSIAANDPEPWAGLGVPIIPDDPPLLRGPIAGLDAVLAALPAHIDAVVCVAGDMPFLVPALLEYLRDAAPGAAALVPRVAGRPEPLLARYARDAVAPVVATQIARGAYAMMDLLAQLDVTWIDEPALRTLDPDLRSIINVNTPEDLARIAPAARS